jgi:F-type H+-transporting ATPase subunit b
VGSRIRKTAYRCLQPLAAAGAVLLPFLAAPAFGAEPAEADWRSIYDTVMLWVNFGILVFVIYYYGRKPIANFLKSRQEEIAGEIHRLEERKAEYEGQIQQTRQLIQESSSRFEKIKSRITEEGRRKRDEIIERANEQSRKLLEMEQKKAANRVVQARDRLIAELADNASELAFRQLPEEITASDEQRMLDRYLDQLSAYAGK